MTRAEIEFWKAIKGRQLGGIKFRRQHSIEWYILDFYSAGLRVAVEIDGDSHETPEAKMYDHKRTELLESYGIRVIRFTNDEILDTLPSTLNRLRSFIGLPLL